MRENRERGGSRKIIVVLVGAFVGVLAGVGIGTVLYRKGVDAGRDEALSLSREAVEKIVEVVGEKDEMERKLNGRLGIEGLSKEGLAEYKAGLEKVISETEDGETRAGLEAYKKKVEEFSEVYDGGDAVAIQAEFLELKKSAEEASESLNAAFKQRLKEAVEKTGLY